MLDTFPLFSFIKWVADILDNVSKTFLLLRLKLGDPVPLKTQPRHIIHVKSSQDDNEVIIADWLRWQRPGTDVSLQLEISWEEQVESHVTSNHTNIRSTLPSHWSLPPPQTNMERSLAETIHVSTVALGKSNEGKCRLEFLSLVPISVTSLR